MSASPPGRLVGVIGSANLDLVVELDRLPREGETVLGAEAGRHPGGKGLNQAVAAAACGGRVRFAGAVGDDEAGAFLRARMRAAGVDDASVREVAAPTGTAHVLLMRGGENSIIVCPGANAQVGDEEVDALLADDALAVVLLPLEIPLETAAAALRAARERGVETILNAAPVISGSHALLEWADIVIVNETEAEALGGVERILDHGVATVVLTRGAGGVAIRQRRGAETPIDAYPVDAVDTTGAGDAFCGAFAVARASGSDLVEAGRFASAAGALTTRSVGAQSPDLTVEAIAQVRAHSGR